MPAAPSHVVCAPLGAADDPDDAPDSAAPDRTVTDETVNALEGIKSASVVTAADAGGVLSALSERQVACVVVVASSPDGEGLDVLEAVRERFPDVPVVVAAPDGSEAVATRALRLGATDYVPAGGDAVVERVRAALDGAGRRARDDDRSPWQRRTLLEALEETFPDSVYIYDAEGRYLDALLGWRRKSLTSREDLLGRRVEDVLPESTAIRLQEAIAETLETGELQTVEYTLGTGSETHWFEGLVTPLPDYHGGPAVLLAAHDVTDRKRYEQRLEAQHRRLERLAEVVSHDLKTPVSTAQNVVRLLRADIDDPAPEVEQSIEDMETILGRIEQFAEHLPKLARESTEVRQPVDCDLGTVAESAWELVETGELDLEIVDRRTVPADPERLRQAFQNLFRNTVEHGSTSPRSQASEDTVEHGTVGVDDEAPTATDRMTATAHATADSATTVWVGTTPDGFYVEDDGLGIGPDQDEEIFDYGMSTGDGSGMGLAIVRTIVEAHGWEITVTDGDEGGARFEITTGRGLDAEP